MLPPCENRAEACWQPVDFKLGKPMTARYSGGFPINLKSDNNVTIMLDFRAKAASIKPRRSSGVRSLHDSRASGRVNKSGSPQSAKQRSSVYLSELKRIVLVI
jgi:hypothetical protein